MLLYHDDGDAGPVVLPQLFLQAGSLCVIGLELVTIWVPGVREPCDGVNGMHINVAGAVLDIALAGTIPTPSKVRDVESLE